MNIGLRIQSLPRSLFKVPHGRVNIDTSSSRVFYPEPCSPALSMCNQYLWVQSGKPLSRCPYAPIPLPPPSSLTSLIGFHVNSLSWLASEWVTCKIQARSIHVKGNKSYRHSYEPDSNSYL